MMKTMLVIRPCWKQLVPCLDALLAVLVVLIQFLWKNDDDDKKKMKNGSNSPCWIYCCSLWMALDLNI